MGPGQLRRTRHTLATHISREGQRVDASLLQSRVMSYLRQAFLVTLPGLLAACGGASNAPAQGSDSGVAIAPLAAGAWRAPVREALDGLLMASAKDPSGRVAVFDWDNTMIKNDVGDAMTYWMLQQGKLRAPAGGDWSASSPYLTSEAKTRLNDVCGASATTAGLLNTPADVPCTKEILAIYGDAKTTSGAAAFAGYDHRRMEPAYAWASALLAGYTEVEISSFADQAIDANEAAPEGVSQTLAGVKVAGSTRLYPEMKELVEKLQQAGVQVWVVSASPEPVVRSYARRAGIGAERVIGIRSRLDGAAKWSPTILGCGAQPDNTAITYIDGKRCWINQTIYGDATASAWQRRSGIRQMFAAGDSNTDITFLRDATGLRLVINRNKEELMCFSYANEDAKWLVQPMFLGPKAARSALYPCASTACVDAAGSKGPCIGEAGQTLADQADSVASGTSL